MGAPAASPALLAQPAAPETHGGTWLRDTTGDKHTELLEGGVLGSEKCHSSLCCESQCFNTLPLFLCRPTQSGQFRRSGCWLLQGHSLCKAKTSHPNAIVHSEQGFPSSPKPQQHHLQSPPHLSPLFHCLTSSSHTTSAAKPS